MIKMTSPSRSSFRAILLCIAIVQSVSLVDAQAPSDAPAAGANAITYKDHIAPLLRRRCGNCHNADKAESDFNVTSYQALAAGGSSGMAITPGSPDQSLMYRLISHAEEPHMPPRSAKLPDDELQLVAKWIEAGAPDTSVSAVRMSNRSVGIDLSAVATGKPEGPPPMPTSLPATELPKTARPHPVTALASSPWAPVVAVAGHQRVLLFNTDTLEPLGVLAFPEGIPHVLKFSRDGKRLLVAGGRGADQGRAVLYDIENGKRLAEVGDEVDSVLAADISPDQQLVALGGPGKLVKVFETSTGTLRYQIKKHTDWVTAIEFSPDGNYLASGDRNGGAFVWDPVNGGIVFTLGDHKEMITDLSWRGDSQMLATSSEDGRVILWYAEDGFPARTITPPADTPKPTTGKAKVPGFLSVRFAMNGTLATTGRDRVARVWNDTGSAQIGRFDGFKDLPNRVVVSHDGARVIVGDFNGTVRVFGVKEKKELGELKAAEGVVAAETP